VVEFVVDVREDWMVDIRESVTGYVGQTHS